MAKGIPLSDIKSWLEDGPNLIHKYHPSTSLKPLYSINNEINSKISIILRGDSTKLKVDAIVNAANSELAPGGGICGKIHAASGPELYHECIKIGHCDTGSSVVTKGYELPSKYVIHAVGPIGEKPKLLKDVYNSVLNKIDGTDIRSIALCCISTGIYGFPISHATPIALKTVRDFLEIPENREKTDRIIFVVYLPKDCKVYMNFMYNYFPLEGEYNFNEKSSSSTSDSESSINYIPPGQEFAEVDEFSSNCEEEEIIPNKEDSTEAKQYEGFITAKQLHLSQHQQDSEEEEKPQN